MAGYSRMGQSASIPFKQHSNGAVPLDLGISPRTRAELSPLAEKLIYTAAADGVAIAILSADDPRTMVCVARSGTTAPPIGALLDVDSGISGQAARENRTLSSEDTKADSRVDKEACERLGIRSVVAAPIPLGPKCIGIVEIFSSNPGAFDAQTVSRIEAEAARVSALVDRAELGLELPDPENWEQTAAAFSLAPDGRLSALKGSLGTQRDDHPTLFSSFKITEASAVRRKLQWIAIGSVAASLAFSAPRLLHRTNIAGTIAVPTSTSQTAARRNPAVVPESTATLVSDAAPSVRMLMAKALGGNSVAQASLANHYATGDGVSRDPVKAAVWAVIAGENGRGDSVDRIFSSVQTYQLGQVEFNLGAMLRDGIGVPRNLLNSYSWFSLSEATGDVRASAAMLNLEQVMSAEQIAEAKRHAPELLQYLKK